MNTAGLLHSFYAAVCPMPLTKHSQPVVVSKWSNTAF